MKKLLLSLLFCLSVLQTIYAKPETRSPWKIQPIKSKEAATIFDQIDFSCIHTPKPDLIIPYIHDFPFLNYQVVSAWNGFSHDCFYVDAPTTDYIKNDLLAGRGWEPYHASCIFQYARPGSIAIDVGAHIGTHTITMSRAVGLKGTVLAFEPNQRLFRELVMNVAILNHAKNVHFYQQAADNLVAFLDSSHLNEGSFVEKNTLDSLQLTNVSLIKIDTDGTYELDILKGARNTILSNRPAILLEICGGIVYENTTPHGRNLIEQSRSYVESLGYTWQRFGDWDYLCLPK